MINQKKMLLIGQLVAIVINTDHLVANEFVGIRVLRRNCRLQKKRRADTQHPTPRLVGMEDFHQSH